ncbi:MAG TPA: 3-deoxy-D-manno-octulosonic acid transferase [Pyrinomonadaceae bacterium]|nr:3-deoxy-D-manno-octulosonic acid transferase [Pyrinomonadaceae bacterium]
MLFAYSILLALGILLLLPAFLLDAARHGKYVAGLRERAGRVAPVEPGGRPVVWLHCVSVGEAQAARPLVALLGERFPDLALAVSTTTLTGQRVAREAFGPSAATVFYFPFDWAWSVRRTLRAVRPSAVLLLETELWPRFLRECRRRGVPVAVVNGRISEKSFRRYAKLGRLIRAVLGDLALAVMQTEEDAARIRKLGLAAERVRVSGNIKFDLEIPAAEPPATAELRSRFRLDGSRPLVAAASTHAPEESIIIEAFKKTSAALADKRPRLLIAPRHPERFAETAALLAESGLSWARRSAAPAPADADSDVILLDTIGELRAAYPLAELVFVGGSIAKTGGHNVLEPAAEAKCVVTGAHTFNFKEIVRQFRELDALVQLPAVADEDAAEELARVMTELLTDDARRRELGSRARAALERSRGATARTVEFIAPLLEAARDA